MCKGALQICSLCGMRDNLYTPCSDFRRLHPKIDHVGNGAPETAFCPLYHGAMKRVYGCRDCGE